MKIIKFEGATMREALAKVKAELGDQAVVVSTRQVRRGLMGTACEISAAIDDEPPAPSPANMTRARSAFAPPVAPPAPNEDVEKLRGEMRSLRALVRTSTDRGATELRSEVAELRKLVQQLAAPQPPPPAAPQMLARGRAVAAPAQIAPSRARAIVLVGPTGAGKTTTIAKLAARAALVEQRSVEMVTLDNYRVGGVDQIRTFAELIGVPLHVAGTPDDLVSIIDSMADDTLVLIDTAGRSPRESQDAIAELARILPAIAGLEVHLVAPAATAPHILDDLARRHAALAPSRLLITKVDELDGQIPELLGAPTRLGMPITWVTTGQSVPEDLEEPTMARLLELASGALSRGARAA